MDLTVYEAKIADKYAKRFYGFRKKRWYTEWFLELYEFLEEIKEANDDRGKIKNEMEQRG